ncbi:hypothetical protein UO65_3418 [Actinokineospora spheciospongiae]|uniref:Uncharacterized protein n=1 Tax=Actinokineospora spheciospongiae TaxID=909613 RepID=W7IWR6_9PSEU|nr:hypothetical protein UO65_3418 [Actinokineospora spheciospongiae]
MAGVVPADTGHRWSTRVARGSTGAGCGPPSLRRVPWVVGSVGFGSVWSQ